MDKPLFLSKSIEIFVQAVYEYYNTNFRPKMPYFFMRYAAAYRTDRACSAKGPWKRGGVV